MCCNLEGYENNPAWRPGPWLVEGIPTESTKPEEYLVPEGNNAILGELSVHSFSWLGTM